MSASAMTPELVAAHERMVAASAAVRDLRARDEADPASVSQEDIDSVLVEERAATDAYRAVLEARRTNRQEANA